VALIDSCKEQGATIFAGVLTGRSGQRKSFHLCGIEGKVTKSQLNWENTVEATRGVEGKPGLQKILTIFLEYELGDDGVAGKLPGRDEISHKIIMKER